MHSQETIYSTTLTAPTLRLSPDAMALLSKKTKIAKKYLIAISEGRIDALPPGRFYRKGLIKKYAKAIGIDGNDLLVRYANVLSEEGGREAMLKECPPQRSFMNIPRILARCVLVIAGVAVLAYIGWQVKNVLRPPSLMVISPHDGFLATEPAITIQGQAEKEAHVAINGEEIYSTGEGYFTEVISLQPGLNEVRITATKKHGRTTEVVRQIIADLSQS